MSQAACLTAASCFPWKCSIHYERTAAQTFNWHFVLAFSYRNHAAVTFFLPVMENACGNNSSVAGAGKKTRSIPQDAHVETGKEISVKAATYIFYFKTCKVKESDAV